MDQPSSSKWDIVMIGAEESWESERLGHRPPMIFRALSRLPEVRKIISIHSPISLPSRIFRSFAGSYSNEAEPHNFKYTFGDRCKLFKLGDKLPILNTTAFFPERDNFISRKDRSCLALSIRRKIAELGFRADILWVADPRVFDIAAKLPSKIIVFDAMDNLMAHPQFKKLRARIKQGYEWAAAHADLIIIASESQREMFKNSSNLYVLPNGISGEFLADDEGVCPPDLKKISSPRVTYVGVMQERIDAELMAKVADFLPSHQFVFVGPELMPSVFDALRSKKNVHFLGKKNYKEIPFYIRHSDVCIIPHRVNEFTNSMNPLKIYEYLACGKPVVATPVAGTEMFGQYVYRAQDPISFAGAVEKALSENSGPLQRERRQVMLQHTWEKRAEEVMGKLNPMLIAS